MVKRIILKVMRGLVTYSINETQTSIKISDTDRSFTLRSIEFRRDGINGLYKPEDEAHYLLTFANESLAEIKLRRILPVKDVTDVIFVEIDEPENEPKVKKAEQE